MRRFLRRKLAGLHECKSGNATLMTALGLPALLGATGYGVDTAQWYMWQRELQHSVDQAAIGGAWALAYDEESTEYTTRAQQEYYANQEKTASFDSAPSIRLADFEGGEDNSVVVTASVTRRLPFTGLLLNRATTVTARAQAAFEEGAKYNACLITLKEDGTTFQVGGNAHVIANCGLAALSCSDDALVIDASATVETTSIATCGTASVPEELESAVAEGADGLYDAYAYIPIPQPDEDTEDRTKPKYCEGNGNNAIANLAPGRYVGGYVASCNTTFQPGVYFIEGGILDLATNATVIGHNVLFVLRDGAQIKLGGSGGTGSVTLSPIGEDIFNEYAPEYAANADRLAGMLFIEDKEEGDDPVDHVINGNAKLNIEGVVYLPNGDVQINGDSGTEAELCFQVSAYTLDIRGNAYLRTLCNADDSTEAGSAAPGVRLVA